MKKIKILIISLIPVILIISCGHNHTKNYGGYTNSKPKLIVGIVADQMAYDYVERYWNKFSANGIKKLFQDGFVCKNAYYEHFPTYTGPGHATIYTGVDPSVSGIVGNNWYDRDKHREVYCTDDSTVSTVGSFSTEGKMSPKNLWVTTITDRLKLTSNFKSKVIGISLKDRAAILPAGHLADGAFWYDGASKNFITSTYYTDKAPEWLEKFNSRHLVDEYLSHDWNTLLPIEDYTESTPDDNKYEKTFKGEEKPVFPHKLSELKYANNSALQYSPFGNSLTKDFAIDVIKGNQMGKGDYTDFLCINFASTDYVGHMYGPYSVEAEDTYLRFDKDIAGLLKFLDDYLGMDNVLVFLTADHGNSPNPLFLKDHKLDAGAFYEGRIKDSCNEYVKQIFNIDNAVLDVINQQIYLDHVKIEQSGKSLNIIEDSLAGFILSNVDGVESAYPVYDLSTKLPYNKVVSNFINGYNPKRSGDIFINFSPYWIVDGLKGTEHGSPYTYDTHVPLVWYGWKVKSGVSYDYTQVKGIVPTLADILNIDVPEECHAEPVKDLLKSIGE